MTIVILQRNEKEDMKMQKLLIFVTGAAIGSLVTWKLVSDQYEKLIQEEVNSVKQLLKKNGNQESTVAEGTDYDDELYTNATLESEKPSIEEYAKTVQNLNYADFSKKDKPEKKIAKQKDTTDDNDDIQFITADEFGDLDDYDEETLYFYEEDETLTDVYDEVIPDEANTVGTDYMKHFDDIEEVVFVRNNRLKRDYEIILNHSSFTENADDE